MTTPVNRAWHQIGKGFAVIGILVNAVGLALPDPISSKIAVGLGTGFLAASVYIAQNPD
jgi:hypothetical protein